MKIRDLCPEANEHGKHKQKTTVQWEIKLKR